MPDVNYIDWHVHPFRAERWYEIWRPALDRAIAFALADAEAHRALGAVSPSHGSQLSEREREVARLVAKGLTSREMAVRLTVTERTVNTHLERIREKLGVRSRAQITAWLLRSGLAVDDVNSSRASSTLPTNDR